MDISVISYDYFQIIAINLERVGFGKSKQNEKEVKSDQLISTGTTDHEENLEKFRHPTIIFVDDIAFGKNDDGEAPHPIFDWNKAPEVTGKGHGARDQKLPSPI